MHVQIPLDIHVSFCFFHTLCQ